MRLHLRHRVAQTVWSRAYYEAQAYAVDGSAREAPSGPAPDLLGPVAIEVFVDDPKRLAIAQLLALARTISRH